MRNLLAFARCLNLALQIKFLRNWARSGLILVLISFAIEGLGQTHSSSIRLPSGDQLRKSFESIAVESQGRTKAEIRLEGMGYLTPVSDQPELTQTQMVTGHLAIDRVSDWLHNSADISLGAVLQTGNAQLGVSEIYTSTRKFNRQWQVMLGRVKTNWSKADSDLHLGLWQPQFTIDKLRPIEQGLTGLFFKFDSGDWALTSFVSPLFIPSMGPDIKEKNGSLVSNSRWYRSPQGKFPLRNKETSIIYSLNVPDVARLASQSSYVAALDWNKESEEGSFATFGAGYKPVNSLALKYRSLLTLPENAQPVGEVTVSPDVAYHKLYTAEVGIKDRKKSIYFSYIEDQPELGEVENGWVKQKLESVKILSVGAKADFQVGWRPVELKSSVMQAYGGHIEDVDSEGVVQGSIIPDRLDYFSVAQFNIKSLLGTFSSGPVSGSFKYLYDFQQKGKLMSGELSYSPQAKLSFIVGADVLGPDDSKSKAYGFLNQYRANDRVFGGMSYVF
jgi:hypothetical protein